MAVNDFQMQYNGLLFGRDTPIGIESISGFEDYSATMGDVAVPREWGDIPGLHTVDSKEIVLEVSTTSDNSLGDILNTFQPSETPKQLILKDPYSYERFVYGRPIGRVMLKNPIHKFKKMVTIRIKAADPRIYSVMQEQAEASVFSATGGLDYSLAEYSKEYVGSGSTGEAVVNNDGNSKAYPVIKIFGPPTGTLLGSTITNLTTGKTAEFVYASSLLSSDVLTADMRRIVVADSSDIPYIYLGTSTNRYSTWQLPREPFYLAPGDNQIRYEVDGTTTDAEIQLIYRHTSL